MLRTCGARPVFAWAAGGWQLSEGVKSQSLLCSRRVWGCGFELLISALNCLCWTSQVFAFPTSSVNKSPACGGSVVHHSLQSFLVPICCPLYGVSTLQRVTVWEPDYEPDCWITLRLFHAWWLHPKYIESSCTQRLSTAFQQWRHNGLHDSWWKRPPTVLDVNEMNEWKWVHSTASLCMYEEIKLCAAYASFHEPHSVLVWVFVLVSKPWSDLLMWVYLCSCVWFALARLMLHIKVHLTETWSRPPQSFVL